MRRMQRVQIQIQTRAERAASGTMVNGIARRLIDVATAL